MSSGEKARIKRLSVQYTANKKVPGNTVGRRTKGVSLNMLEESGLIGADTEDLSCSKFITDLVECQSDVVAFVKTLPELHQRVKSFGEQLTAAAQAGHLDAFGAEPTQHLIQLFQELVKGLDVYAACPYLASVQAPLDQA